MDAFFIFLILIGFYVTWSIGANDVANSISPAVGSGSLSWKQAALIASVAEMIGATFFSTSVITTMSNEIIILSKISLKSEKIATMLAILISTGMWIQISSMKGMPVSTTHSIVCSMVGIGSFYYGRNSINWETVQFIAFGWIISPVLCAILCVILFHFFRKIVFESQRPLLLTKIITMPIVYLIPASISIFYTRNIKEISLVTKVFITLFVCLMTLLSIKLYSLTKENDDKLPLDVTDDSKIESLNKKLKIKNAKKNKKIANLFNKIIDDSTLTKNNNEAMLSKETHLSTAYFKEGQLITSFFSALSHGSNDVANGIAPIATIIFILNPSNVNMSIPLWLTCIGGIGIVFGILTFGKNVTETVGKKVLILTPFKGFILQISSATTVILCSHFGLPVSTTHSIIGGLIGINIANKTSHMHFGTLTSIFASWFITVPFCMILSIILHGIFTRLFIGLNLFT